MFVKKKIAIEEKGTRTRIEISYYFILCNNFKGRVLNVKVDLEQTMDIVLVFAGFTLKLYFRLLLESTPLFQGVIF